MDNATDIPMERPDHTAIMGRIQDTLDNADATVGIVRGDIASHIADGLTAVASETATLEAEVNGYIASQIKPVVDLIDAITRDVGHHVVNEMTKGYEYGALVGVSTPNESDLPPAPNEARPLPGYMAPVPQSRPLNRGGRPRKQHSPEHHSTPEATTSSPRSGSVLLVPSGATSPLAQEDLAPLPQKVGGPQESASPFGGSEGAGMALSAPISIGPTAASPPTAGTPVLTSGGLPGAGTTQPTGPAGRWYVVCQTNADTGEQSIVSLSEAAYLFTGASGGVGPFDSLEQATGYIAATDQAVLKQVLCGAPETTGPPQGPPVDTTVAPVECPTCPTCPPPPPPPPPCKKCDCCAHGGDWRWLASDNADKETTKFMRSLGLDYDVAFQGKTLMEAMANFLKQFNFTLFGQVTEVRVETPSWPR